MFRLAGFSAAHLMLHKLSDESKPEASVADAKQ
jgi:hypothetical protein